MTDEQKKELPAQVPAATEQGAAVSAPADDSAPFSVADLLAKRQQEAERRQALYEQKQQRARDLYAHGQNPILAYVDSMKPARDAGREERARRAAKVSAWGNFLAALGTGITGMATKGYVPKTGSDAPFRLLGKLDEWEKTYQQQNKQYQALRLNALMNQQSARQKAADMDAAAAGQGYAMAQKQYDTLLGGAIKSQDAAQKRKDDLAARLAVETLRGTNSKEAARIRAAATTAAAAARADTGAGKSGLQFLDRDEKSVVTLAPSQASYWMKKGIDAGMIPADGTPLRKPAYPGETVPQFYWGRLKPEQKAAFLRNVYLKTMYKDSPGQTAQETGWWDFMRQPPKRYVKGPYSNEALQMLETPKAEQAREGGFSDADIMEYLLNYR